MKFRNLALVGAAVAMAVAGAIGSAPSAQAYNTFGHRLVYGIGGGKQHYWIAASASGQSAMVDAAMANWINTSSRLGIRTPLYWTKTSTKSAARMEVHKTATVNPWCGLATMWTRDKQIDPHKSNWVWGKIQLDGDFNGADCANRQGIISHEMGHVFGLAHTNDASTLMYAGVARTAVSWATADEARGINALYK